MWSARSTFIYRLYCFRVTSGVYCICLGVCFSWILLAQIYLLLAKTFWSPKWPILCRVGRWTLVYHTIWSTDIQTMIGFVYVLLRVCLIVFWFLCRSCVCFVILFVLMCTSEYEFIINIYYIQACARCQLLCLQWKWQCHGWRCRCSCHWRAGALRQPSASPGCG